MAEKLFVYVVAWDDLTCTVIINDTRYVYRSYNYNGTKLKIEFEKRARYSPGKAIQWIKNNANMIEKYDIKEDY